MTYTDVRPSITIAGIEETTIANYFATINREDFVATAALFTRDGELKAPFEQPIVGQRAIADYLAKEAKGMELSPKQGTKVTEDSIEQFKVKGKVKTPLFSVHVAWYFTLNEKQEITHARIKLLASPQELLGLKQTRENSTQS